MKEEKKGNFHEEKKRMQVKIESEKIAEKEK